MKKLLMASACVLSLATTQVANALSVSWAVGGAPTGVKYVNFDNLTPNTSGLLTATGPNGSINLEITPNAKVAQGSQSGVYAAPVLSGGQGALFGNPIGNPDGVDTTPYLTSGRTSDQGSITMLFSGPQQYLGLLWGSVDAYNTLAFYLGTTLIDTVTGTQVIGVGQATGNQSASGTVYVNINTTSAFDRVVATSTSFAFEFDNVAYNTTPVPDGGTTAALLGLAFTGLGFVARRRHA